MGFAVREKHQVAIVVDSATSVPEEIVGDPRLHVVPMTLTLDGVTYLDGLDVTPTRFYEMLRETLKPPTTSAPSPRSFLEEFRKAVAGSQSILCITVGARFSASYDAANVAAREAIRILPGADIRILDSESAAGGEGLIALQALRASKRGLSLQDVTDAAREVIPRIHLLAFPDTLYYLWKGGRVPRIAYAGTSLIQIKPIFELTNSRILTVAHPRTYRRAMKRLLELMHERVYSRSVHVMIMHADAREAAEELKNWVDQEFMCLDLFISEFTPVMGAHIGPGLLGLAFWG